MHAQWTRLKAQDKTQICLENEFVPMVVVKLKCHIISWESPRQQTLTGKQAGIIKR